MKNALNTTCILTLFFLIGCVSGYKSLDEVPEAKRPIYDATYSYIDCSLRHYADLVNADPAVASGDNPETALQQLADKACSACGEELTAYSKVVASQTQRQDIADAEARKLREKTSEKLVTITMEAREDHK